jgi:hypothetical protein
MKLNLEFGSWSVQAILNHLQVHLPSQPPPRIKASQAVLVPTPAQPSLW